MDAIYVHEKESDALALIQNHIPQFIWHSIEVNEDMEKSLQMINEAIAKYDTRAVLGHSLGGLYLMYAKIEDLQRAPIHRIIYNPVMAGNEDYIDKHVATVNRYAYKHPDVAVFSIKDELIGEHVVLENMATCYKAGFEIMVDDKCGHRLDKKVLKLIQSRLFSESDLEAANAVLYGEVRPIPFTHFYTFRSEKGIGVTTRDGKVLVPAEMDEVGEMMDSDGVIELRKGDKWGCLDYRDIYVEPVYDKIVVASEEMVRVLKNGVWGWLTWEGKFTTDESQADIGSFADAEK